MTLADYELKYGVPADDDLDDIAAEEQPNDDQPTEDLPDVADSEKPDTWTQEVKFLFNYRGEQGTRKLVFKL